MKTCVLALLLLLIALLGRPSALPGQTGITLSPWTSLEGSVDGTPAMLGLSVTRYRGVLGMRMGAGTNVGASPVAPVFGSGRDDVSAWSADFDVLLAPTRWHKLNGIFGDVDPTLFVGVGLVNTSGVLENDGGTEPAWSYGGGLAYPLFNRLSIDAEARRRAMLQRSAYDRPLGVDDGWEFRVGFSVHLGAAPPAAIRSARAERAPSSRSATRPTRPSRSAERATETRSASPGMVLAGNPAPRSSASALAASALSSAEQHLGVPYRWGGNTPQSGFDCSGFVKYVFARHGVTLPRTSAEQARSGRAVAPRLDQFRPGDLLAFASNGRTVDHIAIYAGDGRIIHSSQSGAGVRYDDLRASRGRWYVEHLVAARRIIPEGNGLLELGR